MILAYHGLQPAALLRRSQERQFLRPDAKMQWWYFDVLLKDGGVLVLAFVPRKWWRDHAAASGREAMLFLAHMRPDGTVRSFAQSFDSARVQGSKDGLRVADELAIAFERAAGREPVYRLSFRLEGLRGELEAVPAAEPFSPLPWGTLPGLARSLGRGAAWGAPEFRYAAQVPRGRVRGSLALGGAPLEVEGLLYHEQGRLDDLPQNLSEGWLWFHFLHPDWNIFGCPGLFVYAQEGARRPLAGLALSARDYGLTGGEIRFARKDLRFTLKAEPEGATTLLSFPAVDSRQLWSTSVAQARLELAAGGSSRTYQGQLILETCRLGL